MGKVQNLLVQSEVSLKVPDKISIYMNYCTQKWFHRDDCCSRGIVSIDILKRFIMSRDIISQRDIITFYVN